MDQISPSQPPLPPPSLPPPSLLTPFLPPPSSPPESTNIITITFNQAINRQGVPINEATDCAALFGSIMTINDVIISTHSSGDCRWNGVSQSWLESNNILVGESFTLYIISSPVVPFNLTNIYTYDPGTVTFQNPINRLYYPINIATDCSSLFGNVANSNDIIISTHSSGDCRWNGNSQTWLESQNILPGEGFELYIVSTPFVSFTLS
jgi:hypothetical protein